MKNVMGSLILSALSLSVLSCGKSTEISKSGIKTVFGNDDLIKITNTDYPWRTIVKIKTKDSVGKLSYECTGTLVGPDLLLTASHCLQDENGNMSTDIKFLPAYVDGKGPVIVTADRIWFGTEKYRENFKDDYALVRLNVPLGDTYGYMGVKNLESETLKSWGPALSAAGHAADFGDGKSASVHNGCSITSESDDIVYSDCDWNAGASGGPIFSMFEGKPFIVGVISHSASQKDGSRYPNGTPYSNEIANALVKTSRFFDKYLELKGNTDGVLDRTYLNICNNSNTDSISGAVAYDGRSDTTWNAKGWYNVKKGECERVYMGENYNGNVYVYGQGNGLTWGSSDYTFCVNPRNSFDYESADTTCNEDEDHVKARFGVALGIRSRKVNTYIFN